MSKEKKQRKGMSRQARGHRNEMRTINYLARQDFVAVRAGASKGMCEIDVLAYHVHTGEIKHIQSKSNHHFTKEDVEKLRLFRKVITAENVSVELWDWYDSTMHPIILHIHKNATHLVICDPKLKQVLKTVSPEEYVATATQEEE